MKNNNKKRLPHAEKSILDINQLRQMTDYQMAYAASDFCFLGQCRDLAPLKNKTYLGRVFHPEIRGEEYTLKKNMAFMAGGIESKKIFKLITPLSTIVERARGWRHIVHSAENFLIGCTAIEILCLIDNGYTFQIDDHCSNVMWAYPPTKKSNAMIKKYKSFDNKENQMQAERIFHFAQEQAKKRELEKTSINNTVVEDPAPKIDALMPASNQLFNPSVKATLRKIGFFAIISAVSIATISTVTYRCNTNENN